MIVCNRGMSREGLAMLRRVPASFAALSILLSGSLLAIAQEPVRVEPPGGALAGAGGAGAVVTNPAPLNLNSTLPPALSAPPAIVNGTAATPAAAPPAATGEADTQ